MGQLIAFLNELSVAPVPLSARQALDLVKNLIDALRAVRAYRPNVSLNAARPLVDHLVDAEKTLKQVLQGDDFREEWGFLRRLADRAPIDAGLSDPRALDGVEYFCNEKAAVALGWAHLLDTLAISFASHANWNRAEIELTRLELDAEGVLHDSVVCCRHVSGEDHAAIWADWLKHYGAEELPNLMQLWNGRQEMLPELRFLDRVERDLAALGDGEPSYKQALLTLRIINEDIRRWDGTGVPRFSTKVTGEGEQRKKFCFVRDIDGKEYCFDLHARFTGGLPGRIHFRISGKEKKAVVAYVGKKLFSPIVRND